MRCSSSGDPHFTLFDGTHHSAMGHGEYVYVTSADFAVHVCHRPVRGDGHTSGVSSIRGLAIKSKWGVLKWPNNDAPPPVAPEGSGIVMRGGTATFPTGEVVTKGGSNIFGTAVIELPPSYCNQVYGLCGAFDPEHSYENTLTMNDANKTVFTGTSYTKWGGPYLGEFQTVFAESWKVEAWESGALFTADVSGADMAHCIAQSRLNASSPAHLHATRLVALVLLLDLLFSLDMSLDHLERGAI